VKVRGNHKDRRTKSEWGYIPTNKTNKRGDLGKLTAACGMKSQ